MRQLFLLIILCGLLATSSRAAIDTLNVYSPSMFKHIKCVVVTPTSFPAPGKKYPTVYLLHGYGGNYSNWAKRVPALQQLADEHNILIVNPDGVNSWYFNSPVDLTKRYETHVSEEIPAYIDSLYPTIANRAGRAITGLSMGGHGAMFIAFRHSATFGACGSMSGALDISKITQGYGTEKILGDTGVNKEYYNNWSVINMLDKYPKDSLAIIMDCGTNDFIYQMTKKTHDRMLELKIPHTYIEQPGIHNWAYWQKALPYQLYFFSQFFKGSKT